MPSGSPKAVFASSKHRCDLEGVDPVVLGLAAVDGLHVEDVAQDEGDSLPGAQVGEPVPGEDALDGDDEVLPVGGDRLEEGLRAGLHVAVQEDLTGLVEDAEVHGSGVQIDSAVVAVLLGVKLHGLSSCADARSV